MPNYQPSHPPQPRIHHPTAVPPPPGCALQSPASFFIIYLLNWNCIIFSVRGKIGYTSGVHLWDIHWMQNVNACCRSGPCNIAHSAFGIATQAVPIRSPAPRLMVGDRIDSWGVDLGQLKAYHANTALKNYPEVPSIRQGFRQQFMRFQCCLDMDSGRLGE